MSRFKKKKKSTAASRYDLEKAIPLKGLKIPEVEYGELESGGLELPIGVYLPNRKAAESEEDAGNSYERLVDFEFKDSVAKGDHQYELQKAESKANSDITKHQIKVAKFLGETVATIGGYEIGQLTERYSCSKVDLFSRMWTGDIVALLLGAREKVQGGSLAYNLVTRCECPKGKVIKDDPKNGMPLHSLEKIKFTYLEVNDYPLFVVELPDGFDDGDGFVKNLYFLPLRLFQSAKIADRPQDITLEAAIYMQMCVAMPESQVYGIARGSILTPEVTNLMTLKDRNFLEAVAGKISFGIETSLEYTCPFCPDGRVMKELLNWLARTENFIYTTGPDSIVDL